MTSASLRRLTAHLEESSEIGDVHRADLADGFQGAVLSERHTHAVEGLIHEHLELMLAATEHDHEFPRARVRQDVGVSHRAVLPCPGDTGIESVRCSAQRIVNRCTSCLL